MSKFTQNFKTQANTTYTENGRIAKKSTGSGLVNLFSTIGALRQDGSFDKERLKELVLAAWREDPLKTLKIIFYARDIREGLGEREIAKESLNILNNYGYGDAVKQNLQFLPYVGRWDDLYAFMNTKLMPTCWEIMKEQWETDIDLYEHRDLMHNPEISLLAKWIKTPDASSERTRNLGIVTALELEGDVRSFKRKLRKLREYIKIVERQMSANEWDKIDYEKLPSRAMHVHNKAFLKHDSDRFTDYISAVTKGEKKINSGTLYPYEVISPYLETWKAIEYISEEINDALNDALIEAQWKALPDVVNSENNFLVVADVSGSMFTNHAIDKSISLAIYFAERNRGDFHNLFMSFSSDPEFVDLSEATTLRAKIKAAREVAGFGTNLAKCFQELLDFSVDYNVPAEDMPKSMIVISDMEIDSGEMRTCYISHRNFIDYDCMVDGKFNPVYFMDEMEELYKEHGYALPNIVFWNVNSRQQVFHADANQPNVQLVSGSSTNTFKLLIDSLNYTPYEIMMKAISNERYNFVTLPDEYK